MIYGEMIHDLHPDHMIKLAEDKMPYKCNGCHEIDIGRRYSCPFPSCNFHLHKCCALPERELTPFLLPDYVFKFLKSYKETREPCRRHCNACAKSITGFLYHCSSKDWDLHPSCATLPRTMKIDYGGKKLVLELEHESSSKCDKCHEKEFIRGRKSWAYVSDDEDFHLHIGCVKDLLCDEGKKFNDGEASDRTGPSHSA